MNENGHRSCYTQYKRASHLKIYINKKGGAKVHQVYANDQDLAILYIRDIDSSLNSTLEQQ